MDNIKFEPTKRTPGIDFNFADNTFAIYGESYPEDAKGFFGPPFGQLAEHLQSLNSAEVKFSFDMIYFNSHSAKYLMALFETLDEVAEAGNSVTISWAFAADDSNMQELGEEFGEDLENAQFVLQPKIGA